MTVIQGPRSATLQHIDAMYEGAAFTPEMLLFYMESRLNKLDEALKQQKDKQEKLNKASEILSDLMKEIGAIKPGKIKPEQIHELEAKYKAAMDKLKDIDPTLVGKVQSLLDQFDGLFESDVHFEDGSIYHYKPDQNVSMSDIIRFHDAAVNKARKDRGMPYEPFDPKDVDRFNDNDNTGSGDNGDIGSTLDKEKDTKAHNGAAFFNYGLKYVEFKETDIKDDGNQLKMLTQPIQSMQNDLKNTADLGMSDLNTLTSQKQTCVQLIQQMMQAQAEQARIATGGH